MKRPSPTQALLALIAVLLAANLIFGFRNVANVPTIVPAARAEGNIPLNFIPARPQWVVTADPTGESIYIWKYNGVDYESTRYTHPTDD